MRKIILQEWISLDGFVEDQKGNLDFFTDLAGDINKYSDEDQVKFMDEIDTILLGRKTYNLFVDFWPTASRDTEPIADILNSTHKIVFSNSLKDAPWGNWLPAEISNGEAADKIRELKLKDGKNMVLWGSISLARSLMKEDLIDEFHLQLCPVIVGGGRTLFAKRDSYAKMQLIGLKHYESGTIFLRYAPK